MIYNKMQLVEIYNLEGFILLVLYQKIAYFTFHNNFSRKHMWYLPFLRSQMVLWRAQDNALTSCSNEA